MKASFNRRFVNDRPVTGGEFCKWIYPENPGAYRQRLIERGFPFQKTKRGTLVQPSQALEWLSQRRKAENGG